jgi:hypothetical protein
MTDAVDLPQLVLRRAAIRRGLDDDGIARLRRSGTWTTLQRGAYLVGGARVDDRSRHLLAVRATMAALRTPAVLSHASAAAIHGLPLWQVPLQRVHITRTPPARSDIGTRLRSHVARLADEDVVEIAGQPVTTLARTVVDLACWLPFAPALTLADAALRTVTRDQLHRVLARVHGTRGSRTAARVVAAADGRSESVGESRSRVRLHRLGLPPSTLQMPVLAAGGASLGRTDFAWEEERVVGEFDGRVKYGRLLRPGQEPGDAVYEEKRREDAIRDEGWGVVRWTWPELEPGDAVGRRVARALTRGRRALR